MRKRVMRLCIAMLLVFSLGFVACDNGGSEDESAVEKAKTAVEQATYGPVAQATLNSLSAAKNYVIGVIKGLELSGAEANVNEVSFTAAVAGTQEAESGANGIYKFTATLTKGAASATTGELSLVITATTYTAPLAIEITDDMFTLEKDSFAYKNTAIEPAVTANELVLDTDYTVVYSNNDAPGKATVTITGKGKYTGTVTKNFTIKPIPDTLPVRKPTTIAAQYGTVLSSISLDEYNDDYGTWSWSLPAKTVGKEGSSFVALYTADESGIAKDLALNVSFDVKYADGVSEFMAENKIANFQNAASLESETSIEFSNGIVRDAVKATGGAYVYIDVADIEVAIEEGYEMISRSFANFGELGGAAA